ncbi:MAG: Gfo/Idh/MocA family oxidoreductase [Thermoplasmata archaeon]|nr:MAG: Gfo/Idh/MocA family oxidoreductase [Thermoplasmata archaeon]
MLNIGVIGVGSMGQNHARIYSEIGNLIGLADENKETCTGIAEKFKTNWYTDYKQFLKNPELDAVSIATPSSTHLEIGLAAIEAGKHILVEKPLALTIEDAQKIVDAAKAQGLTLAVGHVERYNPIIDVTKNVLENKQFGDLISISSRRVSSFPARIKDVGVIMDLGIHDIDVLRYLVAEKVINVFALAGATGNSSGGKDMEDHASILLDFESDISGFIEINWLTPMKVRKVSLTCSKNFVVMDYMDQSLEISSSSIMEYDISNLFHLPQKYDIKMIQVKREEPLKNELLDFMSAIESKSAPKITGDDAIETLRIAKAAMESYKKKQKIEL